jgi:hypothetical protein
MRAPEDPRISALQGGEYVNATPLPGEAGIPPFAIYRSKVAAWEDGTIKLLYVRLKGQGARVLIEELPGEDPVELGNKYQLTLVRIEDGEPVPPIEMPTFPILPEKPIYEFPGLPTPEVPIKPEPPLYEKPPEGITPEVPPGKEPPIYEKPGYKPTTPELPTEKPNVPDRDRPQPK